MRNTYTPKHRAPKHRDDTAPIDAVPSQARCVRMHWQEGGPACPRHHPEAYATYMATHATDSIR